MRAGAGLSAYALSVHAGRRAWPHLAHLELVKDRCLTSVVEAKDEHPHLCPMDVATWVTTQHRRGLAARSTGNMPATACCVRNVSAWRHRGRALAGQHTSLLPRSAAISFDMRTLRTHGSWSARCRAGERCASRSAPHDAAAVRPPAYEVSKR